MQPCPEPDRWSELADPTRRDELERHLDVCDDCRALVAALTHDDAPAVWAPELAVAGARIGRYVIERPLGAGGMGVVLAARDPQLERTVALKLVRILDRTPAAVERARTRLIAEARAMARLAHPNVVAVHEIVEDGRELVIVMERVDGADLAKWLAEAPRTHAERLHAVLDAGRGLAAAHAAGLVHRDVKPANILVGRDGRARLTDLGLAAAIAGDPDDQLARGSRLIGTPGYLAPEVAAGARGDERSDQYAFAITARQVVFGDQLPRGRVAAVLRRALANAPGDRYPSVAAMIAALEQRRRWPWIAAAAALAVAAVAIALGWPRSSAATCVADASEGGTWTTPRRALLDGALADSSPDRRLTADTLALVDAHARAWSDAVVDTCRARERETQVDPARGACLEDQRRDLDATLAALPRTSATRALAAIAHLAPPSDCDHPHAVADGPDAQRVHTELRALVALAATGNYAAVRPRVDALAKTTSDPDLAAEIAYHRASWTMRAGDPKAALDVAHEAVALAERAHDDGARLQAMIVLVSDLDDLGRATETHTLAPLLEAAAARQPLSDTRRSTLENTLGNLEVTAGNYAAGEAHYRVALAAVQREYAGKPSPEVAGALQSLGSVLHDQAKLDEAKPLLEQSVAMFEATAGPDHPDLAIALTELGNLAQEAGATDKAAAYYERVIAIRTKALGAEHPYVSEPLELLAKVEESRGHDARAIELYRRAIVIGTKGFGADHPLVAVAQGHLAELVADKTEARTLATTAVATWDASGASLPDAFDARFFLAQLEYADGAHAKARALAEVARAGYAGMPKPYDKTATTMAAWLAAHP